jgi:hypothetical protein
MAGTNSIWDKLALLGGCAGITIAGVVMIVVGSGQPKHGLVAYGVAAIIVGVLGFIFAFKGKPDVGVSLSPGFSINKIGGVLDLPWWVWLIDVGVIGVAAIIANTVLA